MNVPLITAVPSTDPADVRRFNGSTCRKRTRRRLRSNPRKFRLDDGFETGGRLERRREKFVDPHELSNHELPESKNEAERNARPRTVLTALGHHIARNLQKTGRHRRQTAPGFSSRGVLDRLAQRRGRKRGDEHGVDRDVAKNRSSQSCRRIWNKTCLDSSLVSTLSHHDSAIRSSAFRDSFGRRPGKRPQSLFQRMRGAKIAYRGCLRELFLEDALLNRLSVPD